MESTFTKWAKGVPLLVVLAIACGGAYSKVSGVMSRFEAKEKDRTAASDGPTAPTHAAVGSVVSARVQRNPDREAHFGETHVHSEEDRKRAKPGTTVSELMKSGGVALTDAQLKALIVGKTLWVRNTVTGGIFKVVYDKTGQSVIYHVGRYAVLPSEVGEVTQAGYQGIFSAYTIQNGKIVTTVADSPFEVTIYKVGDKHLAARSNEFGYANYEIMAKPPNNLVDIGKE
jgi:hypothetical protein